MVVVGAERVSLTAYHAVAMQDGGALAAPATLAAWVDQRSLSAGVARRQASKQTSKQAAHKRRGEPARAKDALQACSQGGGGRPPNAAHLQLGRLPLKGGVRGLDARLGRTLCRAHAPLGRLQGWGGSACERAAASGLQRVSQATPAPCAAACARRSNGRSVMRANGWPSRQGGGWPRRGASPNLACAFVRLFLVWLWCKFLAQEEGRLA